MWRYRLERDFVLEHPVFDDIAFVNDWCEISSGKLQVYKGYAWDGCSPKRTVLGLITVGAPDGALRHGKPWTYYASLVHDVLCQYRRELKLTKAQVVGVWRDMLIDAQWPLTGLYTKAVDWFGPQDFYNAG